MANADQNSDFLRSCRIDPNFPSVTERYFKANLIHEHKQCVLAHSNRLKIVTLAPDHPILAANVTLSAVQFDTDGTVNRLSNKVSGKFKKGGQKLKEKSILCTVRTNSGDEYVLYSCISGVLIEVNEKLMKEPNLMKEKPWSEGYIAIVLPPFPLLERKNYKLSTSS